MTQFAFLYPARVVHGEYTARSHRVIDSGRGFNVAVFDNHNVYYCQKKEGVKAEHTGDDEWALSSYFVEVMPGIFFHAAKSKDDERFMANLSTMTDENIKEWLAVNHEAWNDKEGYAARKKAEIDQRNMERKRKDAEREAEKAAKDAAAREAAIQAWRAGEKIGWDAFESLCKENNIVMRPNVIGSGRKRIVAIAKDSARIYGNRPTSQGIWDAASELTEALKHKDTVQ